MEDHKENDIVDDDDLSLRDLHIGTNSLNSSSPRTSSANPEIFEFFPDDVAVSPNSGKVIFCGKLIPFDQSENAGVEESEIKHDYYLRNFVDERDRFSNSSRSEHHQSRSAYSVQKVNITSLTSMSAKSRRRMFMFGPVKFKPEMELRAIRERQSRRTPGPMFPAFDGEKVGDGGDDGGKGETKLSVKAVRSRAHLTTVLGKSFGCLS